MGEVYRASDPKIGRDVAIKVLPADFSADKERVARFEQEAQAAGAFNHPNIIAVYDVDTRDGVLYVVSELLEGGNFGTCWMKARYRAKGNGVRPADRQWAVGGSRERDRSSRSEA